MSCIKTLPNLQHTQGTLSRQHHQGAWALAVTNHHILQISRQCKQMLFLPCFQNLVQLLGGLSQSQRQHSHLHGNRPIAMHTNPSSLTPKFNFSPIKSCSAVHLTTHKKHKYNTPCRLYQGCKLNQTYCCRAHNTWGLEPLRKTQRKITAAILWYWKMLLLCNYYYMQILQLMWCFSFAFLTLFTAPNWSYSICPTTK